MYCLVMAYLSMVITGKCIQECEWCWNNATSACSYPEEPIYSELVFKSQTELDQTEQFPGQVFMPRSGSISLISPLINPSGCTYVLLCAVHKRLVLVPEPPGPPGALPLPMRCKPPYPSPPSYSSPPAYPDFQLYDWDLVQTRQNNNLSSDSDYFSSSTYRANDNYKGKYYSPHYPSSGTDKAWHHDVPGLTRQPVPCRFLSSTTAAIIFKCECRELELKTRQ